MGCDGGTIPTRDELVRLKKKPEQKDRDSERIYKWRHCSLSQETLRNPIVSCELGKLYNKESVINHLLDRKDPEKRVEESHLKTLKDVRELDLTDNPAIARGESIGNNGSPWICPITGLEMNGRFKFVWDWSNGRVISERAMKVVNSDAVDKILEENLIIFNPEGDDLDLMRTKMEGRRARVKAEKKKSKRKTESQESSNDVKKSKKDPSISKKNNSASLQSDNSKSEVFKSIFSSHPTAQNQPKGNWVTFDPRYN